MDNGATYKWFGVNNTWRNSGDPANGSGSSKTGWTIFYV